MVDKIIANDASSLHLVIVIYFVHIFIKFAQQLIGSV